MLATSASPAQAATIAVHETQRRLPLQAGANSSSSGSILSPRGPVRSNGLDGPCSSDRVIVFTGHLVSAVLLYFVAGSFLLHSEKENSVGLKPLTIAMLVLHVPSMFLIATSWWSCVSIDPSRPTDLVTLAATHNLCITTGDVAKRMAGFKLSGPRWEKTRCCAVCRKAVPGLHHHSTWVQTCVGKANYVQFCTIEVAGTVQFVSQALFATICLAWLDLPYDATSDVRVAMQGVLIGLLLISVPCTLMYFILLGFHQYLNYLADEFQSGDDATTSAPPATHATTALSMQSPR